MTLTNLDYSFGLTDEQLKVNQEAIDIIDPYMDSEDLDAFYIDSKELLKLLWNHGYKITPR